MDDIQRDDNGVPLEFPSDLDTSNWPDKIEGLRPSHLETKARLWGHGGNPLYDTYIVCLDELIDQVYLDGGRKREGIKWMNHRRNAVHPLFCKHYGHDFPPYVKMGGEKAKPEGPACPQEHLAELTKVAHALEKQLGTYESAEWAARLAPVVVNLGWEALKPEEVPGTKALGMLQQAVTDMAGFYEKVLSKYTSKPAEKGKTTFKDDGGPQIAYTKQLERRARKRVVA